VREVRNDGKDGRRGEECEESATCDDGEGKGRSMKRTQSMKLITRRQSIRGEWERKEDDGNSVRTPSSSSLTLIDD
jgi:hypothetical protein